MKREICQGLNCVSVMSAQSHKATRGRQRHRQYGDTQYRVYLRKTPSPLLHRQYRVHLRKTPSPLLHREYRIYLRKTPSPLLHRQQYRVYLRKTPSPL
jgi:hypothetical protein